MTKGKTLMSKTVVSLTFHQISTEVAEELMKVCRGPGFTPVSPPAEEEELEDEVDEAEPEEEDEELAPKAKSKKKKAPTRDDVLDALRAYAEEHSKEKAIKILEKVGGVKSALKLEEDKFEKVINALAI